MYLLQKKAEWHGLDRGTNDQTPVAGVKLAYNVPGRTLIQSLTHAFKFFSPGSSNRTPFKGAVPPSK